MSKVSILFFILALCFGTSLGIVNDYLGHFWYLIYLNIAFLIVTAGLFWGRPFLTLVSTLSMAILLGVIDYYQLSPLFLPLKPILLLIFLVISLMVFQKSTLNP